MFKTPFAKFSEEAAAETTQKPAAKDSLHDPAVPLEKEGHVKAAKDHLDKALGNDVDGDEKDGIETDTSAEEAKEKSKFKSATVSRGKSDISR